MVSWSRVVTSPSWRSNTILSDNITVQSRLCTKYILYYHFTVHWLGLGAATRLTMLLWSVSLDGRRPPLICLEVWRVTSRTYYPPRPYRLRRASTTRVGPRSISRPFPPALVATPIHGLVNHAGQGIIGHTHAIGLSESPKNRLRAITYFQPSSWQRRTFFLETYHLGSSCPFKVAALPDSKFISCSL